MSKSKDAKTIKTKAAPKTDASGRIPTKLRAILFFKRGERAGEEFELSRAETVIGRSDSCDLAIEDGGISRRHCLLRYEKPDFVITDLQSQNGTFINDENVRERVLKHRDEIVLGDTHLQFVIEDTLPTGTHEIDL